MTNFLITGGAGFIGSHLIESLLSLESDINIYCVDNFDVFYSKSIKMKNIGGLINNERFTLIESDILNDGSLDYDNDILASFDFIVASIHSNLKMDIQKATNRLLKAIENPYTTMLGHPTGRLLLRREGYPIDHKVIIDACAANNVIIEINASPWRLDLDWRWVHYALEKGVKLSINPDAHEMEGYHDMYYGVCVGRKGGLTADMTFNAMSQKEVEAHFIKKKG